MKDKLVDKVNDHFIRNYGSNIGIPITCWDIIHIDTCTKFSHQKV